MFTFLIPIFAACVVAGVINKDIFMVVGAGFMLLSCSVVFAAVGISHELNND
jgi:hypothetical protein